MIVNPNFYEPTSFEAAIADVEAFSIKLREDWNSNYPAHKKHILFISVPMKDRDLEEIQREYKAYAEKVDNMLASDDELFVIPSIFVDAEDNSPYANIMRALSIMGTASIISFPHFYYESRGCNTEYDMAHQYLLTDSIDSVCIFMNPEYTNKDSDHSDHGQYTASEDAPLVLPIITNVHGTIPFAPGKYLVFNNVGRFF